MRLDTSNVLTGHIAQQVRSLVTPLSLPIERIANIDRLRIVAAIGIVWFHTADAPYRRIGYAGLPIFLLIFFSLIARNVRVDSTVQFLKRRWRRLVVPWLFWSAVYGLCKLARAMCMMEMSALRDKLSIESLLAGTHIHLWYLPYAFVLGLVVFKVHGWTLRLNNTALILTATIAGVLALAAHAATIAAGYLTVPLSQWGFGLAAVPLGFAIGRSLMVPSRQNRRLLLLVVSLMTLIACLVLNSMGFASPAIPYGLATTMVCLAYAWQAKSDAFVACVAPLTFGIYLMHPLIGYAVSHFLVADEHFATFIALTVCISGLATLGLMRTPLRRFV